jgi:hypothetical protein
MLESIDSSIYLRPSTNKRITFQVNPIINAVVNNRFEAALAEAKEVDRLVATESDIIDSKPFLGKYE